MFASFRANNFQAYLKNTELRETRSCPLHIGNNMTPDEIEKIHAALRFLDYEIGRFLEIERKGYGYTVREQEVLSGYQACRFVINDLLEKVFVLEKRIKKTKKDCKKEECGFCSGTGVYIE